MNRDPIRLIDDPHTPAQMRSDLIAFAREVPFDVEAGLARLQATLAKSSAPPATTASGVGMTAAVAALAFAGSLVAVAGWQLGAMTEPSPPPTIVAVAPVQTVAEVPRSLPAPLPPVHDTAIKTEPQVAAVEVPEEDHDVEAVAVGAVVSPDSEGSHRTRTQRDATSSVAAAKMVDPLREARELQMARGLLERDPARALRIAETGAREFRGNATFAPEWESVIVLALYGLDRHREADVRARALLDQHPHGTYAHAVLTQLDRSAAQHP